MHESAQPASPPYLCVRDEDPRRRRVEARCGCSARRAGACAAGEVAAEVLLAHGAHDAPALAPPHSDAVQLGQRSYERRHGGLNGKWGGTEGGTERGTERERDREGHGDRKGHRDTGRPENGHGGRARREHGVEIGHADVDVNVDVDMEIGRGGRAGGGVEVELVVALKSWLLSGRWSRASDVEEKAGRAERARGRAAFKARAARPAACAGTPGPRGCRARIRACTSRQRRRRSRGRRRRRRGATCTPPAPSHQTRRSAGR